MAGYSVSTATALMRKPRIIAALAACAENARRALGKAATRKPYRGEPDGVHV